MEHKEAVNWKKACDKEIQSFRESNAFEVVLKSSIPRRAKAIDSRWVYNVKKEPDGERFKARIVAKGSKQEHGMDYTETYAPVMKLDSFRFVLAYAAQQGWRLRQLDAKNAFLNGDIDCEIYLRPPPGVHLKHGTVWKLRKSVYGLKANTNCIVLDNQESVKGRENPLFAASDKEGLNYALRCLFKKVFR